MTINLKTKVCFCKLLQADVGGHHTDLGDVGESARIRAAGGFIDFGRVNGNLALSRAVGDFEFKKNVKLPPEEQIVTAFPDVTVHEISDDDEFLVLACDGSVPSIMLV